MDKHLAREGTQEENHPPPIKTKQTKTKQKQTRKEGGGKEHDNYHHAKQRMRGTQQCVSLTIWYTSTMMTKEYIGDLLAITASLLLVSVVIATSTDQCVRKDFSHIPGVYAVTMVTSTDTQKPVTVAQCTRLCRLEVCTGFNMRWTDVDVRQRGHCYLLDETPGQQYRREQNWTLYYQTDIPVPNICPVGYDYVSRTHQCYKLVTPGDTWNTANHSCSQDGANTHLLSLESPEEEQDIFDKYTVTGGTSYIWTSGKFGADGQVYWHEGDQQVKASYSKLGSGGSGCVLLQMTSSSITWMTFECIRMQAQYICEF